MLPRKPTGQISGECVLITTYLINHTLYFILLGQTSYEKLFQTKPSYSHLKVFGCLCYASTHSFACTKFNPCAKQCIFIGYPYGKKECKLYDLEN